MTIGKRAGGVAHAVRLSVAELSASRLYRLLVGLTAVTVTEAVCYAWIEVLLFTSDSPILKNLWLFHHYTTYHLVLAILVVSMVFGVGFFGAMVYVPGRFVKFIVLAAGDFLLWLVLEDEFFFIFSGSRHTPTDWSSQIFGTVPLLGYFVPTWYLLDLVAVFACWYFALRGSRPTD